MYWRDIKPIYKFIDVGDNRYALKIMNTCRLVTEYSNCSKFGNITLYIHNLESSKGAVIGYEIKIDKKFNLIVNKEEFVIIGTSHFRPSIPKIVFDDNFLRICQFGNSNFVFISKRRLHV